MKRTLELYVEPENIPQKYGGKLDFKFGDLPVLEPAIEDSLVWNEPERSKNGHRTMPTGPIRWQYDNHGDLEAVAVGSINGKPRNKVIAGLHPDKKSTMSSLTPGRNMREALFRTTTGEATHPPTPPESVTDRRPSNMTDPDPDHSSGLSNGAHLDTTSRAGTYTVPYRDSKAGLASPPDSRQGTSATRYEQQDATHAAGELAHGTPSTQVNSQGDRTATMEPRTVGQAPKEHPATTEQTVSQSEDPEPQPSYMDQAKQVAGQAYEQAAALPQTVMGAVGMGGQKQSSQPQTEQVRDDPRVEQLSGEKVEEMLRAQTMSKPQA